MVSAITLFIDGKEIQTQAGKTIIQAAMEAGLYIPYLCYYPGMKPFGACRMCVVEVENARGTPASCTTPVADGMVVHTTTDQVQDLRKGILDLVISEHPHGCLTCHRTDLHGPNLCGPEDICLRHVSVTDRCVSCPKNERCELKDTAFYVGTGLTTPLTYNYRNLPILSKDPFFDLDFNLCIVCGRCVRACEEIRGDSAITFTERAGISLVGPAHGTSLLESGCEFCGACLDVCPVGALVESDHKWEKANEVEKTICPLCPVGCQMNLEVNKFGKVIRAIPELNSPANKGQACFKGKFGMDFVNRKERLRKPLIRRGGSLEEATWEEALDFIAEALPRYKGSQFAMLTAPDSTNEEHYLAQKFTRAVMVTNNVDQTSNTHPELVGGLQQALGYAAGTNPIWDLEDAGCILTFCTNTTEEHNVAAVPIKRAVKAGTELIVVDHREVELTRYAKIWLRPRPGTELLLLGGLLKAIVEAGLQQEEWVQENCEDPEGLLSHLGNLDLDSIANDTAVPADEIRAAAQAYGSAAASAILYALDNVPGDIQRDCVLALTDLALLTGNLGKPSAGLYPLRQGANEQGAWDMGCVPHFLPGYVSPDDTVERERIAEAWGIMVPIESGLDLRGILHAARQGEIKAMFVVGEVSDSRGSGMEDWSHPGAAGNGPGHDPLSALENLDFLVVQDHFLGPTAERAHVVLPRSSFAEKEGTYTNLERRVQPVRPVLKLKNSEAQPEGWVICNLAQRMRAGGFEHSGPDEVMQEIARLVPDYHGISHRRLQAEGLLVARPDPSNPLPIQLLYSDKEYRGLQWPCPAEHHGGTDVLYAGGFPAGKARLAAPDFRAVPVPQLEDYPFLFVPGRVLLQSERELEVVPGRLNGIARDELVELSSEDAARLGITEGDGVEVRINSHRLLGKATIPAGALIGVVSSTGLFGQLAVELQASEDPHPMSSVLGLRITPAAVAKIAQ